MKKHFLLALLLFGVCVSDAQVNIHALTTQVTSYYNTTGQVAKPSKVWCQQVAAAGNVVQVVDISSAAFTTIRGIFVAPETSSGTLMQVPYTHTLTKITINVPAGVLITYAVGVPNIGIPTLFTGTVYNILVLGD